MAKHTFRTQELRYLVGGEECGLEVVSETISGTSRWSIHHSLVFKDKASRKFYATNYSVGATEQQDERPFEYAGESIECDEVRPVEKVVIVYEPVP